MASIVVMHADDRPARDRSRSCDACGRRGTFARISRRTDPPTDHHYCRRCWSSAHRRFLKAQKAAVLAWFAASHDAFQQIEGRRETVEVPAPESTAITWHCSLIPGTWWREYRYRLRRSDVAAV